MDLSLSIIELLRNNSGNAYTINEVFALLLAEGISCKEAEVNVAITELENMKKVESKLIDGVFYYICCKAIGFRLS
ncbi:MAG: hypothetical protein ACYDG5_09020 [Dehalococcoidales bacterium]